MRPVSSGFLSALHGSHRMFTRARIVHGHQTGVDPDGTEIPVLGGDVSADANSDVRSTVDMSTSGYQWAATPDDLVTPYGPEVFVERGIVFGNGDVETVSQGYFRIDSVDQDRVPNGPLRIAGSDRMAGIIDAKLPQPVQFGVGTTIDAAVSFMVRGVYPDAQIDFDFDAFAVAFDRSYIVEKERYSFLKDVADSFGKVVYWDYRGHLVMESPPSPGAPVWQIHAGRNGVLVDVSRQIDRNGVYNGVVAQGESPGDAPPVRAFAWDDDPDSATYYYGPFGQVVTFYTSDLITTEQQARVAAETQLRRYLGLPYSIDLGSVPNPALQPWDPISVAYPGRREVHVVDQVTLPLEVDGSMEVGTRQETRRFTEER